MTLSPTAKVWLRSCGGGTRFPGHQGYVTVVGDSIVTEGRTVYVRADLVEPLVEALRIIAGRQQCIDNLMSKADVANAALQAYEAAQ